MLRMLVLLMVVKLRRRRIPETLRKLRKMLMEMKTVSLILCCLLGEGACRGKRIRLGEKCSGMIGMGISLLRSWNSNRAMLVILMMRMQILAYVLSCRYHSVHHLSGYVCWVIQLGIFSKLIFMNFTASVIAQCVKDGPKVLRPKHSTIFGLGFHDCRYNQMQTEWTIFRG